MAIGMVVQEAAQSCCAVGAGLLCSSGSEHHQECAQPRAADMQLCRTPLQLGFLPPAYDLNPQ